jgi:hypothetical protein
MSDYPILKVGSKGPAVLLLKAHLAAKGWPLYKGSDDPTMYSRTCADVGVFQATHLGPTGRFLTECEGVVPGVVDALTWQALEGKFDQKQGTPVPELVKKSDDPRARFINQLAAWYAAKVREIPKGSNEGPVISDMQKFHGLSGAPWCAMTVNYAHQQVFGTTPPWGKNARVCSIYNKALALGLTVPVDRRKICPGDLAMLVHGGLTSSGKAPDANGHIWTVTAMDGSDVLGLDGNSDDRLRASRRDLSQVHGIIRLWPTSPSVKFNLADYESGPASDR